MKGRDQREGQERSVCAPTKARSGRESLPESWEALGDPPKGTGGVRRPFWRDDTVERVRMGLEALLEGREGPGSPPRG